MHPIKQLRPHLLLLPLMMMGFVACYSTDAPSSSSAAMGLGSDVPGVQDRVFVRDALSAGRTEMHLGLLGAERAENLNLKLLAQRIFDDHSQAARDLKIIAAQEEIPISSILPDPEMADWANVTGVDFDRLYLQRMMGMHRADIKRFEAAARTARNPEVRAFAGRMLPVLREHHRIAQNIGKTAGLGEIIEEAAGAQPGGPERSPFYEGDAERPHQFDKLK